MGFCDLVSFLVGPLSFILFIQVDQRGLRDLLESFLDLLSSRVLLDRDLFSSFLDFFTSRNFFLPRSVEDDNVELRAIWPTLQISNHTNFTLLLRGSCASISACASERCQIRTICAFLGTLVHCTFCAHVLNMWDTFFPNMWEISLSYRRSALFCHRGCRFNLEAVQTSPFNYHDSRYAYKA